MYTLQSLWTMAREGLDVTTILFNNGSYAVLNMELGRVGAEAAGPKAKAMLDLHRPDLDFVALAQRHGRARDARDDRRGVQRPARPRARHPRPVGRRGDRPVDRLTTLESTSGGGAQDHLDRRWART